MNLRLTKDLIKSAKQTREIFFALKHDKFIDDKQMIEMFKSITDPLHKLTLNKADEVTAIPQQPTHKNLARIATLSKMPK